MILSKKKASIFTIALIGILGASLSTCYALGINKKIAFAEPEFTSCASIKFADNFVADYTNGTGTGSVSTYSATVKLLSLTNFCVIDGSISPTLDVENTALVYVKTGAKSALKIGGGNDR